MSQRRTLPSVLEVLDDGLRLYRRHLAGYTLVATAVLVLLAIVAMSWMAFVRSQLGISGTWVVLGLLMLSLLSYPILLYAFAALSRATGAVLEGQPITLQGALRISPMRGCGMIFFNALFSCVAAICAGIVSFALSCPLSYLSLLGAGLMAALPSGGGAGLSLVTLISLVSLLWSFSLGGAWLTSLVYALQPFVLEQRSIRQSMGRGIDLLVGRFGRSMLMFLGAGAIFATLIIAYLGSLLVLLATLEGWLGLDLPQLAQDVVVILLTIGSLVLLLPPLTIWMALFYRQLAAEYDGRDIATRINTWHAQVMSQQL